MSPGTQNTGRSALSSVAPWLTRVIVDVPLDMLYYYKRIPVCRLNSALFRPLPLRITCRVRPLRNGHSFCMGCAGDVILSPPFGGHCFPDQTTPRFPALL
jgi:hypothetical protein